MEHYGKTVALHNLGCKVNAYELEKIAGRIAASGFRIVPFTEEADIYVINTCTVTNIADRKSRQMLHRAKKQNPDAFVVALGCFVDTTGEAAMDPVIDLALGNAEKQRLPELLAERFPEKEQPSPEPVVSGTPFRLRTRAFLKIQDGCNLFCSYCVIPFARGRSVSRGEEEILREAENLAAAGAKEIVLTGIHLSSYDGDLAGLLESLEETVGIERVRLGSLEPGTVTEESVRRWGRCKKLCPHFHLSLQSGADSVLRRMRRRYTTQDFAKSAALLRDAFPGAALTTDLITGFPGETQEEFEEGMRFVEDMCFYETHIFPFSARKGTAAEKMPGQLPMAVKKERAAALQELNLRRAKEYRARFPGREVFVLWEERVRIGSGTYLTGHTPHYVKVACPEIKGTMAKEGEISSVVPEGFLTDEILVAGETSVVVE